VPGAGVDTAAAEPVLVLGFYEQREKQRTHRDSEKEAATKSTKSESKQFDLVRTHESVRVKRVRVKRVASNHEIFTSMSSPCFPSEPQPNT
jgi:hypothetical protein